MMEMARMPLMLGLDPLRGLHLKANWSCSDKVEPVSKRKRAIWVRHCHKLAV